MDFISIIFIAFGLAMDAFAASISCGLSYRSVSLAPALLIGAVFGFFQGLMPVIGWLIGCTLGHFIRPIDHWIAFILLGFIGGNMVYNGYNEQNKSVNFTNLKILLGLAVATSIDALATGVSFSVLLIPILTPAILICTITFITSFAGVLLGQQVCPYKLQNKMEVIGGLILITIGLKILIEHLLRG